jgi:hypothetical protein
MLYLTLSHLFYDTADSDATDAVRVDAAARPNPYVTGYGARIPTPYWVRAIVGGTFASGQRRARWYRVYAMCYGNSASLYIHRRNPRNGQDVDYFLDSLVEHTIERARDAAALEAARAHRRVETAFETPYVLEVYRRGEWRAWCGLFSVADDSEALAAGKRRWDELTSSERYPSDVWRVVRRDDVPMVLGSVGTSGMWDA